MIPGPHPQRFWVSGPGKSQKIYISNELHFWWGWCFMSGVILWVILPSITALWFVNLRILMSYTKYKNLKSNFPVQFDSNESLGSISHSLCLVTSHWWLFIIWRTVNTAKVIYAFKIVLYFQYEGRKWPSYKLRRHSKLKKKKKTDRVPPFY